MPPSPGTLSGSPHILYITECSPSASNNFGAETVPCARGSNLSSDLSAAVRKPPLCPARIVRNICAEVSPSSWYNDIKNGGHHMVSAAISVRQQSAAVVCVQCLHPPPVSDLCSHCLCLMSASTNGNSFYYQSKAKRLSPVPVIQSFLLPTSPSIRSSTISHVPLILALLRCPPCTAPFSSATLMCRCW